MLVNPAQATGPAQTDYGFTGEFTDASGLVYLRARYYAPEQGRFITRDTWEGNVNTPASLNRFNYAHSNPVMNTDPSGNCTFAVIDTILCSMVLFGATGGLIGGTVAAAVAGLTWKYARDGECACTDTYRILMYSQAEFMARATLVGVGLGVLFGAIAGIGALPAAGVSALGMVLSLPGIQDGYARYKASNYQDKCALVELVASAIGFGASAFGGLLSVGKMISTGSLKATWVNISPEQALINDVIAKEFQNPYFRRIIPDFDGYKIITGSRPRFWPEYDPNITNYGEVVPNVSTKIGPKAIQGGRFEILKTIIHEEVHHWLYKIGAPQFRNIGFTEVQIVEWVTNRILGVRK